MPAALLHFHGKSAVYRDGCIRQEIRGFRLVGSCHTPIAEEMVNHTRSPRVLTARKAVVELLFAGHTPPCVKDGTVEVCQLHVVAADLEVGPPRFPVGRPRFYPVENISPYVRRDLSKCTLCLPRPNGVGRGLHRLLTWKPALLYGGFQGLSVHLNRVVIDMMIYQLRLLEI
jgi:hypothetical protein